MTRSRRSRAHPRALKQRELGKERLNALSEGVFAIVMTLMLVTIIEEISGDSFDANHLVESLHQLWPKFVAFIISFFVIGAAWIADNVLLEDVRHVDVRFLWLKLIYLLMVTLLVFSTTLLGEHPDHWLVEAVYGFNMLGAYFSAWWSFKYAIQHHLIELREDNQSLLRSIHRRIGFAVLAYAIGPFLSIWNPIYSFVYFMVIAFLMAIIMLFSSFEWSPLLEQEQEPES